MLRRALVAATLLAGLAVPAARAGDDTTSCDWPMFGHDAGRSFATAPGCTSISRLSAPTLTPGWDFHAPDAVSASPAVVGGHVYVGDWAGNFYSFDAATGALDWEKPFVVDDTSAIGFGRIVSSAAVVDGVVIFGGGATLYALDTDGTLLNRVCLDPRDVPEAQRCHDPDGPQVEIESSPAVVKIDGHTYVFVGMDVHNGRNVGRAGVVKLELTPAGLAPVWKFDPDDRAAYAGAAGLIHGSGSGSGCADVWGSPAVDVDNDLVFFGTGSCSNQADADAVGEHLFAISMDDGSFRWADGPHTGLPGLLDDDFGGAPNLLPAVTDHPNGLVGAGSKDGWYYAWDRTTGALVWSNHVGQYGHLTPGFAMGGVLASAATGYVNDEPAVFIATALGTPNDKPVSSGPDTGPPTVAEDPERMASLHAISAVDGRLLWRSLVARQAFGAPTYANGVVLVPSTASFSLVAVDANTGITLSQRPLPGPPSSPPVAVGDTVYGGIGTSTEVGSPLAPLSGVYAFRVAPFPP